jgi:MurNAc alpha-1-phosphate uridylyltransferase
MHAMILAAGRGNRLRPLTDTLPKPLIAVAGKPLIVHCIERLVTAGIHDIVINHAYLGALIEQTLGDGQRYGAQIHYSREQSALDTGGGIARALPLLASDPFLVVNADVWCDIDISMLDLAPRDLACLVLVTNPAHNPHGDFVLAEQHIQLTGTPRLTFAGIGLYRHDLFQPQPQAKYPLTTVLHEAIKQHRVAGYWHTGQWFDVGTLERLQALDQTLLTAAHTPIDD